MPLDNQYHISFVTLAAGPPVELGFTPPRWADTAPIDPGSLHIIRGGCRILYDPEGLLARLVAAVRK